MLSQLDDSALLMQQRIAEREEQLKRESQKKDNALIEARRRADDLTRNIADLEEELASVNGRMAQYESGSYMLADAVREVKDLKIRVRSTEDKLVVRTQQVNRLEETVEALHDELELMRAKFGVPAESKLDLSGLKVKRALELERLKSVNTQLERDIEQLENERYELHQELRHAAMRRADIAMQVGLSSEDLQKLEAFSDYLKSGGRAGAPAEMIESGDPATVQRKVKVLTNKLEEFKREASEQRALAEECAQQNDALKKEVELLTKDKEVKERAFFKEVSDKIDSMFSNQRLVGNVSVIPTAPARQSSATSQQNVVHVHSGQTLTPDVIQDIVAQAVRQFSGSLPSFTSAPAPSDTSALSIEAVRKQAISPPSLAVFSPSCSRRFYVDCFSFSSWTRRVKQLTTKSSSTMLQRSSRMPKLSAINSNKILLALDRSPKLLAVATQTVKLSRVQVAAPILLNFTTFPHLLSKFSKLLKRESVSSATPKASLKCTHGILVSFGSSNAFCIRSTLHL